LRSAGLTGKIYIMKTEEYFNEGTPFESMKPALSKTAVISRFDSDVFVPPFRLGRKQKRAILDARGIEVIIMPHNSEKQAQMYCDYLNGL
jgi:hypothetical protein